ncbi:hypothetical protein [Acidisoma cladoniae]|jgi:hypothetical protein|uniref:hypothetical protein n=1 Tax=Acidisoma cladoniae TaxID=3040935 RepID=UPI00254DA46B|nr:hypothetical protein [Acidisoma sp. PAMC 29798]
MEQNGSGISTAHAVKYFLSAEVGKGASGERLTVSLTLAHLGLDPVLEAEYLVSLSREIAESHLAQSIIATPGSMWDYAAATPISHRLVQLLPVHAPPSGRLSRYQGPHE